eukprot:550394-Prymnesium_polylepis.1
MQCLAVPRHCLMHCLCSASAVSASMQCLGRREATDVCYDERARTRDGLHSRSAAPRGSDAHK